MKERVIIIGGSPAAYMCSIYVHTANIPSLVVKTSSRSKFDFSGSDKVAGVNAKSSEEFTKLLEDQARNMNIQVVEGEVLKIVKIENIFRVETSTGTHEATSLVIDDRCVEEEYRQLLDKGVFYTNDRISHREAIVVASAGCKAAFDVKEFIENVTK